MIKATVAAVKRAAEPEPHKGPQLSRPGAKKMIMTCSIRGVPRIIQTKVLEMREMILILLMEQKAMRRPRGRENSSVSPNNWMFSQKLSVSLVMMVLKSP